MKLLRKILGLTASILFVITIMIPALPLMYIYAIHRTANRILNESKVL